MVEPCCFGTQLSARIITIRRQLFKGDHATLARLHAKQSAAVRPPQGTKKLELNDNSSFRE
jgi:hypothetical protein